MAFSYSDDLSSDADNIRFWTGDTVANAGPRPDKRNYSDNEVAAVLAAESTVNASVAAIFEALTAEWRAYALSEREGDVSFNATEVANGYEKQAAKWRNKPGGGSEAENSSGLITLTREDAYT